MSGLPQALRVSAALLLSLGLSACNKDLEERIDRLEAELRGVRSDTRETVDELKTRVISAKPGRVSSGGKTLDERIRSLEDSFGESPLDEVAR